MPAIRPLADGLEPGGEVPPGAAARTAMAVVPLAALWALAFTGTTPLYPTLLAGAVAMAVLARWVVARLPTLALNRHHLWLALVVAVVHYLVGAALYTAASRLLPDFADTATAAYDQASGAPVWVAVLIGGLLTAPLEEVFWRGAVQQVVTDRLAARWPTAAQHPAVPIVASAVVYGLFHMATTRLALVAAALLGGLVWGWLLHRTRSLGAVMLAHAAWTVLMLVVPPGSTLAVSLA